MQPIRQGDVILIPLKIEDIPTDLGRQLPHLALAQGEVTGHRHQITEGEALLYQMSSDYYLKVISEQATLTHEEHKPVQISQGIWAVKIQREYEPKFKSTQDWRYVSD